ncbi:MAG: TonB family protein [Flavobacterium sp.]|nr:TonB family protein [Flavobacterium sp.]
MLGVLFVLEYNFKDSQKTFTSNEPKIIDITEKPFTDNFEIIKKVVEKPYVKPVEKIVPKVIIPEVLNDFKLKDNTIELQKLNLASQDNVAKLENTLDTNTSEVPTGKEEGPVTPPNINTVEQLPMFKACKGLSRSEQKACFDEQLVKAISRNLVYPENDFDNRKQGTALIEFVIDENGNITNVKPLENNRATPDMKKAAEKALKKIPQLIPAKQGTKNVRIKYAIPITFKIN